MRIAVIGGLDRAEADFQAIAARAGHVVELHTGHMNGRGGESLKSAIARADFVVLVTDVNSHGAVQAARKLCQRAGRSPLIVRKCGSARFAQIADALRVHEERLRVAS
jgi:hypothetical protein